MVLAVTDGIEALQQSFEIIVVDPNVPVIIDYLPAAGDDLVPTSGLEFSILFSEIIQPVVDNPPSVSVIRVDDSTEVEVVATESISIVGDVLFFNLQNNLQPNTQYQLLLAQNTLADLSDNVLAQTTQDWLFTTANNLTVATDDIAQTNEDEIIQINVLDNDFDSDSLLVASSVQVIDTPLNGSVSVNVANGVITYTPAQNFAGEDSFTYTVADTQGEASNIASVFVTVLPVNDKPNVLPDQFNLDEDQTILVDVLANDIDIDDEINAESLTLVTEASNGIAVVENGEIRYSPNANFVGTDSFSYRVADLAGDYSESTQVLINVQGFNDAPIAVDDEVTIAEDQSIQLDLITNDSDIEDLELFSTNIRIFRQATSGQVVQDEFGEWVYQPQADFNGQDSFEYILLDSESASSDPATVFIEVTPVADAPVTHDDQVVLVEDAQQVINVLGNDLDVENDIDKTSVEIVQTAEFAQLSVDEQGMVTYSANADYFGSDSFSYRVFDQSGLVSNVSVVNITVTAVNDAPHANNDIVQLNEDGQIVIDVLANDQDIDGSLDASSVVIVAEASLGIASVEADGSIVYQANENANGTDTLSYQVADDQGELSNIASVEIEVLAVNDLPVITSTATTSVLEDQAYQYQIEVTDIEDTNIQLTAELPEWLNLQQVDGTTYLLVGQATESLVGTYPIQLIATDSAGGQTLQEFDLEVISVNDAPIITQGDNLALTVIEDQSVSRKLSLTDSDSTSFIWTIITPAQFGVATVNQGLVSYVPLANSDKADSFVVELSDGELTDTIEISISVTAQNDAPQILLADGTSPLSTIVNTLEDQVFTLPLTALDPDTVDTRWIINSANGQARVSIVDGLLHYQPAADYFGPDTISVTLTDGQLTDTLSIIINVASVNDAPVIQLDEQVDLTLDEDQQTSLAFSALDEDMSSLQWSISEQPLLGEVTLQSDHLVYQSKLNQNGTDNFVLTVSDGELSDSIIVNVAIAAINDAPVAVADTYQVNEGGLLSVALAQSVLINDSDVDAEPNTLTLQLVSQPSRASVFAMQTDGSFEYQHDGSEFTQDSFSYRVFDGQVFSNTTTVNIRITAVNDPPLFTSTLPDTTLVQGDYFEYFVGVLDPDDANLELTYQGPDWLSLDGLVLSGFAPTDLTGNNQFTLTVKDLAGASQQQNNQVEILQREGAEIHITAKWSNSPAFIEQNTTLTLTVQSLADFDVNTDLQLELSEGVAVVSSPDCSFTQLTANCQLNLAANSSRQLSITLTSTQVQDAIFSANLTDDSNNSLADLTSSVSFIKQAVNQGNASFDINNATAFVAADIGSSQGLEVIAGTEIDDSVKILSLGQGSAQGRLLAEIDNLGQTENLIVKDFNLDGQLDVFVLNSKGQASSVHYQTGELTFTADNQSVVMAQGKKAYSHDFNADGFPDLAIAGIGYNLSIYINVDGYFTETPDIYTALNPIVSIANLKVDNKIAIATTQNLLTIFYQLQNSQVSARAVAARPLETSQTNIARKVVKAAFVPASEPLEIVGITDIAVADLDGDASEEIVVTAAPPVTNSTKAKRAVSIISTTADKLETVSTFGSSSSSKVEIADFDGDNKPDLMVGNTSGLVQIYRNKGTLNQFELQDSAIVSDSSVIVPADLNGDGLADIISFNKTQGKMALFTSNNDGSMGLQADLVLRSNSQIVTTSVGTADQILYQLWVENLAQVNSLENKLNIQLGSENFRVDSMPQYCIQVSNTQVECSIGSIIANSEISIPFVLAGQFVEQQITATHSASLADTNPDNNRVVSGFNQFVGDVAVSATALAEDASKQQFSYTATVRNYSQQSMTNNQLKIAFPQGLGYLSIPSQCVRVPAENLIEFLCQLGTMVNGSFADISFSLTMNDGFERESAYITAITKADTIESDISNNTTQTQLGNVFPASGISSQGGAFAYIYLYLLTIFICYRNLVGCRQQSRNHRQQSVRNIL